jgi:hypothetical protein
MAQYAVGSRDKSGAPSEGMVRTSHGERLEAPEGGSGRGARLPALS